MTRKGPDLLSDHIEAFNDANAHLTDYLDSVGSMAQRSVRRTIKDFEVVDAEDCALVRASRPGEQ